jgi:hypothetical protein
MLKPILLEHLITGEPYNDNVLGLPTARANMMLGFDANGSPTLIAPGSSPSVTLIDTVTGLPVTLTIQNGALVY